jgi:hypothetical protein
MRWKEYQAEIAGRERQEAAARELRQAQHQENIAPLCHNLDTKAVCPLLARVKCNRTELRHGCHLPMCA